MAPCFAGVDMAVRMEHLADPMQTAISADTWALVRDEFDTTDLDEAEIKGFGTQHILSLDAQASAG